MLGLEKRIDAVREMQGAEDVKPETAAGASARTGIMLGLIAILVAFGAYVAIEGRYSGKLAAYETRLAAAEAKASEAADAPREMARKMIVANTLDDVSQKVTTLKGQLDAPYQERLVMVEELLRSLRQDLAR